MENKLPEGWEWKKLGEIGEICSGGTPSTRDETNFDGNIPWVTPADLSNFEGIYIEKGKRNISEKGLSSSSAKLLPKNSVIFSSRAPIGYVAIASNPLTTNQGFKNIILKEEILPEYIYYYLKKSKRLVESYASGTTFLEVSATRFSQIPVVIPPLETQQKIVSLLEKAEETKKLRAQADELTQKLLQSVFLEMFGDPVKNPHGFEIGEIGDLVIATQYGTSKKANEDGKGIPVLRMNNITYEGNWDLSSLKYIELNQKEMEKYLVYKGELLFNRTNSKELVGKSAVYKEEKPMAFAGYLIKLITESPATSEFIAGHLNSKYGKMYLENMAKNIVGMANINAQEVQRIPILLPSREIMEKYSIIVKQIEKTKQSQKQSSLEINNLFDALMQKAFIGELVS